jgi:hypothetical protein
MLLILVVLFLHLGNGLFFLLSFYLYFFSLFPPCFFFYTSNQSIPFFCPLQLLELEKLNNTALF